MFQVFYLFISLALSGPIEIYSDGRKYCTGTWVSSQGHFLTNLDCLKDCAERNGVLKYTKDGVSIAGRLKKGMKCEELDISFDYSVLFLGPGDLNFSLDELMNAEESKLMSLKNSRLLNGDGNFAIFKSNLTNTQCLKLNTRKFGPSDRVRVYGDKYFLPPITMWDQNPLFSWNGIKEVYYRSIAKEREYLLLQLFVTPYSHVVKKSLNKNGWPIVNEKNEIEGLSYQLDEGILKIVKMGHIFNIVNHKMGLEKALEVFDCKE